MAASHWIRGAKEYMMVRERGEFYFVDTKDGSGTRQYRKHNLECAGDNLMTQHLADDRGQVILALIKEVIRLKGKVNDSCGCLRPEDD
jgi:hypothetical protein